MGEHFYIFEVGQRFSESLETQLGFQRSSLSFKRHKPKLITNILFFSLRKIKLLLVHESNKKYSTVNQRLYLI